jgi:Zn-dependent peptidase ImmA (M78 family)/DNA-binding XRE family transcriptional regulator
MDAPTFLALPSGPFCPSRFAAARLRRGLGVAELAELIGVHRHAIARYEAGQFVPTAEHVRMASKILKFPERFFQGEDLGAIKAEAVSLRAGSNLAARSRDMALGTAAVAVAFNREAERFFALPEAKLPDYSGRDPERAAELLRGRWDLGAQPIASLMPLLEEKGIRIFSLPADVSEADTFSFWHRRTPFILLKSEQVSHATCADLAYELGHLVIHRNTEPASKPAHEAAKIFAEAFMLPANAVRKLGDVSEVSVLVPPATHFGTPPMMLVRRLHRLGVLSEWRFRALRTALEEQALPDDAVTVENGERSMLLPRVFSSLRSRGVTKHKLGHVLNIYPKDLDGLTFGIASALPDEDQQIAEHHETLGPKLRLVEG